MKLAVLNLIILFFIITAKAPFVWGFSVSRTDAYLAEALRLNLAHDNKWLKLGHYQKNFTGGFVSGFRGPLFLHPEGFKSPQKELEETIRSFFSDNYKSIHSYEHAPQCQFLARRNWLIKKLKVAPEDILPCDARLQWKRQLGATSASLIFASADLGNPASSFGHTFIKLINPANAKNKDLIDYGVNFAANANESDFMYAFLGLFGLYGGIYTMLPYHQKIREYINLEGRDIVEYSVNFTPDEVDELVNHLLELEKSQAPYYFFTTNCSYQLLTLFDTVRPELRLSEDFFFWVIPIDTVKKTFEAENLISGSKHTKSLNTDYLEGFARLNYLQKKALDTAVDKLTIPNDYELTAKEKAEVYETGMKYFAVKAYRSGEDLDEKKYQLSLARAQLGPLTTSVNTKKEFAPEKSHDSSAIYFGVGNNNDSTYNSFKFRPAFHDLEQPDMGVVPMSLNNVATAELRYYDELKKWSLDKFTLMHLINTTPVTQLDKNVSWKAKLDILDSWRPDVEYAAGYSFELGLFAGTRLASFISARYIKDPLKHTYQVGPELLLITRPTDTIGLSLSLTYFAEYENIPYLRFNSKLNYHVSRNFDIQIQGNDRKDFQFNLVKNFIF